MPHLERHETIFRFLHRLHASHKKIHPEHNPYIVITVLYTQTIEKSSEKEAESMTSDDRPAHTPRQTN